MEAFRYIVGQSHSNFTIIGFGVTGKGNGWIRVKCESCNSVLDKRRSLLGNFRFKCNICSNNLIIAPVINDGMVASVRLFNEAQYKRFKRSEKSQ